MTLLASIQPLLCARMVFFCLFKCYHHFLHKTRLKIVTRLKILLWCTIYDFCRKPSDIALWQKKSLFDSAFHKPCSVWFSFQWFMKTCFHFYDHRLPTFIPINWSFQPTFKNINKVRENSFNLKIFKVPFSHPLQDPTFFHKKIAMDSYVNWDHRNLFWLHI